LQCFAKIAQQKQRLRNNCIAASRPDKQHLSCHRPNLPFKALVFAGAMFDGQGFESSTEAKVIDKADISGLAFGPP